MPKKGSSARPSDGQARLVGLSGYALRSLFAGLALLLSSTGCRGDSSGSAPADAAVQSTPDVASGATEDARGSADILLRDGRGADLVSRDGSDAIRSCDGVTCSGAGTCFIDAQGFARCNCNTGPTICLVPTADLQCIESYQICLNANINCGGTSHCTDGLQCCGDFSVNPRVPYCGCDRGYSYDGTTCVPDVTTCAAAPCLISTTPATRRWDLQATGDVAAEVIDERGGSTDRYWDSDGNLQLYNHYGTPQCGSISFSHGLGGKPGSFTFATSPMRMAFQYAGKTYSSTGAGALGSMTINAVTWCKDFNCTVVDLTFAGTLAATDGTQVQVQGFVNGQDF